MIKWTLVDWKTKRELTLAWSGYFIFILDQILEEEIKEIVKTLERPIWRKEK